MRPPVFILLVLAVWGVKAARETTDDDVLVPQETLRFLLDCKYDKGVADAPLPVFHTDIDTESGTTSQRVTLLDTDQLKQSLRGSVHSEEVLELIVGQLNAVVKGAAAANAAGNSNRLRHEGPFHDSNSTVDDKECTINNNIDISVPAQEVDDFNDRVQMLIQQNSFLLLEQINTLFTYKLRSLREDFEGIVKKRTKSISRKLDAVLKALGATVPDNEEEEDTMVESEASTSVSEASTGTSSEVNTSTDAPGMSGEEEQTGEEDEETTEEPTEGILKDGPDSTRIDPSRPVTTSPRPVQPIRTRYPTRTSVARPARPGRPERPTRYQSAPGDRSRQSILRKRAGFGLMGGRRRRINKEEIETQK